MCVSCINPHLFTLADTVTVSHSLADDLLGALSVVGISHHDAPVGHRVSGIKLEDLPKGAFGFQIPKAVQLSDSLVEELLRLGRGSCDWE